jgi:hypothetical protein
MNMDGRLTICRPHSVRRREISHQRGLATIARMKPRHRARVVYHRSSQKLCGLSWFAEGRCCERLAASRIRAFDHPSGTSGHLVTSSRRLAIVASRKLIEWYPIRLPTSLGEVAGYAQRGNFLSNAVATNWLRLVPSAAASRSASSLIDTGRRSG